MSWKEWTAIGLVIGFGIFLQIPGHDATETGHEAHPGASSSRLHSTEPADEQGPFRTVALEVTGMT